jgi:hypothetical protein
MVFSQYDPDFSSTRLGIFNEASNTVVINLEEESSTTLSNTKYVKD